MAHTLVDQLRFTRSEFVRGLTGISDEEARHQFPPMNCLSWTIAHLAAQEQWCWLAGGEGKVVAPRLFALASPGSPATTPPLDEVWALWHAVIAAADPYLDTLTANHLLEEPIIDGQLAGESLGTMLRRVTYHYWYHLGEAAAIRQLLGHTNLPEFVGDIAEDAAYRPEG